MLREGRRATHAIEGHARLVSLETESPEIGPANLTRSQSLG
jgi:hypothetical protein